MKLKHKSIKIGIREDSPSSKLVRPALWDNIRTHMIDLQPLPMWVLRAIINQTVNENNPKPMPTRSVQSEGLL